MQLINQAKEIFKRRSIADILTLQVASVINRLITLVSSVLLARFLGPDNYGLYSLVFVFTSLLSLVDIGYTKVAISLLPEAYARQDKQEIKNILSYLFKINLFIYLPVYLAVTLLAPYLTLSLYENFQVGALARLVILSMLLGALANILNLNLEAQRKMKHLSLLENGHLFLRSGVMIIILLLGGGLKQVIIGYFFAELAVFAASLAVYIYWAGRNTYIPQLSEIVRNMSRVRYTYNIKFSLSVVADSNVGNFLSNLPLLILSVLVSPATVGFYKLAMSYMSLPLAFLSPISRLLNVKLPADKVKDINLLKKNFYRSSLYAGVAYALMTVPFIVLAKFLILFFYGEKFAPAINISYWLAGFLMLTGFSIAFGPIYRACRKVHLSVIFNILRLIFGVAIFAVCFYIFKLPPLISVLVFQLFLGLSVSVHFLFIKKLILDKLNPSSCI